MTMHKQEKEWKEHKTQMKRKSVEIQSENETLRSTSVKDFKSPITDNNEDTECFKSRFNRLVDGRFDKPQGP